MRFLASLLFAFGLVAAVPAAAQSPAAAVDQESADLQASIRKLNAYVELLNRTLRATESINRYQSWVNIKTGPTGRERIVYGLYSLYDVRTLVEKASAATTEKPAMPALDAQMTSYIAAYQALAPVITEANGYYERQDYKVDHMAEGKSLHARLVATAPAYLTEREKVDVLFAREKARTDMLELSAIEKREGRKARWHVTNVMIRARGIVDLLPDSKKPQVEMPAFDAALADYGAAVKDMDMFGAANPNSFFVFESQPRTLLGKLREFRDKLARARGDGRRAGSDLTWIVNDYNMMINTSRSATQFNR